MTFNTLVDGWVKRGDMARAEGVVDAMVRRGVKPNKVTFNTLADGWVKTGDMDRAQGVVDAMVAKGMSVCRACAPPAHARTHARTHACAAFLPSLCLCFRPQV